ncbi:MAG TPA: carboxypeptidase-like regulatory domain-containing protein, partial [Silvibacterium sp.]|nr:carboxypeptidase-like regulatory domain-containing protein [Silvibacterium sp.]
MIRAALVSALLLCPLAIAQSPASAVLAAPVPAAAMNAAPITGTVADITGAIIPGAQVILTDASGVTYASTTTDASGSFQ